jgi:small subunit ribosomal protein S16
LAVHVRLQRKGAKKRPFFRIVAVDSRRARDSRYLENLGTYNPIATPAEIKIDEEKLSKWLNDGARPSDTVRSLLTQIGFLEKYHKAKAGEDVSAMVVRTTIKERKKRTRKVKKAAVAAAEAAKSEAPPAEEAPAAETPPQEAPAEEAPAEEETKEESSE